MSVWGDRTIQAKLQHMYRKKCRCLLQLYDVAGYMLCGRPLRFDVINVAQSEQNRIPFGHLLKTKLKLKIGPEKESDWNQIHLQSEHCHRLYRNKFVLNSVPPPVRRNKFPMIEMEMW